LGTPLVHKNEAFRPLILDNWILLGQDGNPAQPVRLICQEQI